MRNVLEYLEQIAVSDKKDNKIMDFSGEITYTEFLCAARNTAAAIFNALNEDCGVQDFKSTAGKPVTVLMDKGINALTAFMGIVYYGGFYILINPELPDERIEKIISVTDPELLITDNKYKDKAEKYANGIKVLCIEELKKHIPTKEEEQFLTMVRENSIDTDPLYANFTSGSTGIPKGVLVSHRSVIDFIDVYTELFNITGEDVIGNQAPFDFDVSVKDIYSAFRTGANLVIIDKTLFSKPMELLDCLCDRKITVMTWAVSALCLITTFHALDYRVPTTVKKILFSGEVMPMKHLKEWMDHLPEAMFVNLYGPTEITCNCTYHIIDRNREYEEGIPIGKAFPNERVFLLDEKNRVVLPTDYSDIERVKENSENKETEDDVEAAEEMEKPKSGEICVAGTALALGYYNAPAETDKAFVMNPSNRKYGERIYRTGDMATYNERGELVFAGRKDFQIKHMGHRIELEEIEKSMMAVDGIERCCCVFDEKKSRLTGFYVGSHDSKKLHEILTEKLPAFMVPGALKPLDEMPMTKNGKIDRKLLKILAADRKAYKEYVSR
ncbi:MAG: AMP-binding protein [Lachnospiraceae bacterium]